MKKLGKLRITTVVDHTLVKDPVYKVEDDHTLYMHTRYRKVAEKCYNSLKAEYERQKGKQNAS